MKSTKEMTEVMQAYLRGEQIEERLWNKKNAAKYSSIKLYSNSGNKGL